MHCGRCGHGWGQRPTDFGPFLAGKPCPACGSTQACVLPDGDEALHEECGGHASPSTLEDRLDPLARKES